MWHFVKRRYDGLDTLLNTFLKNNVILPADYAKYMDVIGSGEKFYQPPVIIMEDEVYTFNLDKKEKNRIDKLRKKIGMHSFENQTRFIINKMNKKRKENYSYRLPAWFEVYPYTPALDSLLVPLKID